MATLESLVALYVRFGLAARSNSPVCAFHEVNALFGAFAKAPRQAGDLDSLPSYLQVGQLSGSPEFPTRKSKTRTVTPRATNDPIQLASGTLCNPKPAHKRSREEG